VCGKYAVLTKAEKCRKKVMMMMMVRVIKIIVIM